MATDERQHHPSALRNRAPILEALLATLTGDIEGEALEIASGSGCHVVHFAPAFPKLKWQPTEFVQENGLQALQSINVVGSNAKANVLPALGLDASKPWAEWPAEVQAKASKHALVYCSNVTHISPWSVTCGIIAGAGQALQPGGHLMIYGPFKIDGAFTTESNADFDASLRSRDPQWGYRDVAELQQEAAKHGLELRGRRDLPANNCLLDFVKSP